MAAALSDPDLVQRLRAQGAEAQPSTPREFLQYMRAETERARKVIAIARIQSN